jgi:hypothetical protein
MSSFLLAWNLGQTSWNVLNAGFIFRAIYHAQYSNFHIFVKIGGKIPINTGEKIPTP